MATSAVTSGKIFKIMNATILFGEKGCYNSRTTQITAYHMHFNNLATTCM